MSRFCVTLYNVGIGVINAKFFIFNLKTTCIHMFEKPN